MERYDTDKDGAVTQAEAGDFWEGISSADADKDGTVTAKEMYVAWSKATVQQKRDPETVIKEIQAAVENGRITPEQGKERIEAYKKQLAEERAKRARIEEAAQRIRDAVDAGEITPE